MNDLINKELSDELGNLQLQLDDAFSVYLRKIRSIAAKGGDIEMLMQDEHNKFVENVAIIYKKAKDYLQKISLEDDQKKIDEIRARLAQ